MAIADAHLIGTDCLRGAVRIAFTDCLRGTGTKIEGSGELRGLNVFNVSVFGPRYPARLSCSEESPLRQGIKAQVTD